MHTAGIARDQRDSICLGLLWHMYFLGGMATVIFGAVMPNLLAHYHVTYTMGGLIVFMQAIGFLLGVPLVTYVMRRYHYKHVLSGCALAVSAAQLVILLLPPLKWVLALAVLNGMGAGSLETAVATYIMEMYIGQRAVFMSRLEVSFGLGALCLPLLTSVLIAVHLWRFAFVAIGVFALVLALVWQTSSISLQASVTTENLDATAAVPPEFHGASMKYIVLSLFLILTFFYVGLEGSLNSFLPSVFTTSLHALPYYAAASVSVFWMAMVLGRAAIGWVARRVNYERYLFWSILGALVCLLVVTQSTNLWTGFAIVLGLGVFMSAIYSITMVYANRTFPGMERKVTSLVTAFAGIGGAVFPAVTGYAMDHIAPEHVDWLFTAFASLIFLALLSIFGILRVLRR